MSTVTTPVEAPTITPAPADEPWFERHTDPAKICEQQKKEQISPDTMP